MFGAEILVEFEDAVVALARVIVTAEEVRLCCRRAPDARRPEILVGGDHHRIYRDAVFVQDELGAGDPGIRNDRSLERVADHILLLLVGDEFECHGCLLRRAAIPKRLPSRKQVAHSVS